MDHQLGKSRNGTMSEDVAQTAYTVAQRCLGMPAEWESADHFAWDRLATKAMRFIDEAVDAEAELSARELAKTLFLFFKGNDTALAREQWGHMPEVLKLAWEAVGRHVVNCLDCEPGAISLREHEDKAVEWFHHKTNHRIEVST